MGSQEKELGLRRFGARVGDMGQELEIQKGSWMSRGLRRYISEQR